MSLYTFVLFSNIQKNWLQLHSMGPKGGISKRNVKSFHQGCEGMNLRSGPLGRRQVPHEDGSSRILPLDSPRKRARKYKRCPFVDDEASEDRSIEGASNVLLSTPGSTPATVDHITPQTNINRSLTFAEDGGDIYSEQDGGDISTKHNRNFGENISLGLMNDVLGQFYVTRGSEPPLIPLCRLVARDVVRVVVNDPSWLTSLFDRAAYVQTMGSFTVSLKGRHGETKMITQEMIDRWDPIWQRRSEEFEN